MAFNIDATPKDLNDLHKYLYEHQPDIKIDEIYKNTQGYLKEPVVVTLIASATLTPVLITAIISYFKYKASTENVREQEITKRFKIVNETNSDQTPIDFEKHLALVEKVDTPPQKPAPDQKAGVAAQKAAWDIDKAEKEVQAALSNDSEIELLAVLKKNSFLFYDLYFRKHGVQPIFHEVNFGAKLRCDFAWLNDNSSGPEWVIVEIEKPEMRLFTKAEKPAAELNNALEQVRSWDRYFKEHRDEARRIFGAVATFRYILIAGSQKNWSTEQALRWRVHHHGISNIEIRSMDTFLKSIEAFKNNPQDFWSFEEYPVTQSFSDLEAYWQAYSYMDLWRKVL